AGDANRDGRVDGADADAVAAARMGAYSATADFDLDGDVDASDSQLLFADLGYAANLAPSITTTSFKTHVALGFERALGSFLTDPELDRLSVRITGTTHGTAKIVGDGRSLEFAPEEGFSGTATATIVADDGYSASAPTTLSIDISAAPLLRLDFDLRHPKMRPGDLFAVKLV